MEKERLEQVQPIVLQAISEIKHTDKPERYASMNYSVYEVALRAVEIALYGKEKKQEVYVLLHEYNEHDYQGSDVCGIYYDEEKALQKAKTYAENEIKDSNYDESEISYHDNGRLQEIYYNDGYYDIFKVASHEIR